MIETNKNFEKKKKLPLTLTLTLTLTSLFFAYVSDRNYGLIGAVVTYTFFILISALQSNLLVSIFLIASSFLSLQFFFIEPIYSFSVNELEAWFMLLSFTISGIAIVYGRSITLKNNLSKAQKSFLFYSNPEHIHYVVLK